MSADEIIAMEIGKLFVNNVRLNAALEQAKAEIEKLQNAKKSEKPKKGLK